MLVSHCQPSFKNKHSRVTSHFQGPAMYINHKIGFLRDTLSRGTIYHCKAFGLIYLTPLLLVSRDVARPYPSFCTLCKLDFHFHPSTAKVRIN